MTRYDDSVSRERRRAFRLTSGNVLRSRLAAIGLALGFATFSWTAGAFSADYGSGWGTSSSAVSAASKSQYLQAQRQQAARAQQNQAASEALYQQELLARQQNQAAMAQYQAQRRKLQQSQASIPAAPQTEQSGSSKKLLSGLWHKSDSSQNANAQQSRQSLLSAPFQSSKRETQNQEPERNNFLGFSRLTGRSSQSSQKQSSAQYAQAQTRQAYSESQAAAAQAPYMTQHAYAGAQAQYAHSPYTQGAPSAAPSAEALAQASTDRNDARDALAKIPWNSLSKNAQAKIQQMASSSTIYRRLPMAGGRCNPELFDYFLSHPNAVVELWRSMGYEDITVAEKGNGVYEMREKSGSAGTMQILYQDTELAVVYCVGSYRGPAFGRQMSGEMVLILQTRYTEDAEQTPFVVCRLDMFVDLKNPGFDFLARTFSSTVGKIADSNFQQTLAFVDSVSQTIEANPRDFASVALSLQGLSPDARRLLAAKAERVGAQAQARARGEMVEYQLLAKQNQPNATYARILSRGSSASRAVAQTPSVTPRETASPNVYAAAPQTTSFSPSASTPGLSTSRNSSLGKTVEFDKSFDSNEFALSDDGNDDYMSDSDWDEEGVESVYDSSESMASSGSSLAKVGAKPSTHAKALSLLDEQESHAAPSYSAAAPSTLATDDGLAADDSADVAMPLSNDDSEFTLADESSDDLSEEDPSDLIAIPLDTTDSTPLATESSEIVDDTDDSSIDDSALLETETESQAEVQEETPVLSDDAPLLLMPFDDEEASADSENADAAASSDASAPLADDAPVLVFSQEDDEDSAEESADASDQALNPAVVMLDSADSDAEPAANAQPVAPSDAKTSAKDVAESKPVEKAPVKTESAPKKEKVDPNAASGWKPIAQNAKPVARKPAKVAMRIDAQTTKKPAAASNWNGASAKAAIPSVPSKFVTRRYVEPSVSDDSGVAPTIPTFDSDEDDGAMFKKPN